MKLLVAWNVWNNYEDTLLGSEIARLQNDRLGLFESLHLISQGGYPEPPSASETTYLDEHVNIEIDEQSSVAKLHPKFVGVLRVMKGIQDAFFYAHARGCDYAVVTNADAWYLDSRKLHALLSEPEIGSNAVSTRVGRMSGLDLSYGSFVPFFDDHFIILNVSLCAKHKVFEYDELKAHSAVFTGFGGIHYMLNALFDERVPPGLFHAYSHYSDCVNHFGEPSGLNLLPWQYQPKYAFLHANCAQEPDLHGLRAEMLCYRGLDEFPAVADYCQSHSDATARFGYGDGYVYYRQQLLERFQVGLALAGRNAYHSALRALKYGKIAAVKRKALPHRGDALRYFDLDHHVLPTALASRRRVSHPRGPGAA